MTIEWIDVMGSGAKWRRSVFAVGVGAYCMEWNDKPGEWWITDNHIDSNDNIAGPFDTLDAAKAAYLLIYEGVLA